ncbi:hypothetical protein M0R45_024959 [Rubus argutus]|uniref:Reverse transcriptase domain-containing protein n=1 Tax=Rubus argutus TaxID=59490 RepID=A0AAW1WVU6_RUBAR
MSVFNDFINEANLCDPPLLNAKFTWSNMRDAAVWRRLDRFLFSADWEECFPNVRQCALTRVTSDHCPIELNTNSLKWGPGPFRVENMWLKHPSFKENFTGWWETDSGPGWEGFKFMNKLRGVKTKLKVWSKEVFGDVLMEKKSVEMKIKELDNKDEREGLNAELKRERESLRNKFEELLFNEEMLWRQRAKIKWAKEGDSNTKFFHCLATGRRKINLIEKLVVEGGRVVEDAESIELELIQYYKNLYSSSNQEIRGVVGLDWSPISGQEAEWIERPFQEEEIKQAVFDCSKDKSPGPDGFTMAVFQSYWDTIKSDLLKVMEEFYSNGVVNAITNETYICLIPKKVDSLKIGDYRPISLVTSLYKIIAKVLASRLKEVLGGTISIAQGAFVKGRQILDAVLVANEVVEETKKKKNEGLFLKVDFEKAYDHIEWTFLDHVLEQKGFGQRWRKWIGGCLQSANFSIMINGRPRGKFSASRGLRQGDPLSPFLFTLVVDVLSRLLEKAKETKIIEGLVVGRERVEVSHLQFADDTIFLASGCEQSWCNLLSIIECFGSMSGMKINKAKCSLVGINVEAGKVERLANLWGCTVGSWPMKYLGLPLGGNPRASTFWNPVVEKVEKRLQSWKMAFLSRGGRLTLIQAVLENLPTYYLSLFKLPKGVARKIESMLRNFLWEGIGEDSKDHLVKWIIVSQSKEKGGLGIGNLAKKNTALLGKWLWRFPLETDSLWHIVIRSKYGLKENGWDANCVVRGSSRNPWRDISSGIDTFLGRCLLAVGKGDKVRFWEDTWLGHNSLMSLFPRLFHLSRFRNSTIDNFVDPSIYPLNWDFGFRRNLSDVEVQQLTLLLLILEGVRLFPSRDDSRKWSLESHGKFSCKSFGRFLDDVSNYPSFDPYDQIWKAKVPTKVKITVWALAHGKINTCDVVQRKRPGSCLSPNWCIMCKKEQETIDHVFLHCPVALSLWMKLFREVNISWIIPKQCFSLLCEKHKILRGGRKAKAVWGCLVLAVFWVIWLERNQRIFEDKVGAGHEELWDRIKFWSSLWVSVTHEFKDYSLAVILRDWKAAAH